MMSELRNDDRMLPAVAEHLKLAVLFSAALNILMLAPSLYMLQVYDRVLVSGGLLTLAFLSIAILVALSAIAMLEGLRSRLMARAGLKLDMDLCETIIKANISERTRARIADGSSIRHLDQLRQGLASPAFTAVMDVPWTPLFIFVCFVIHPWVGALALGGAALIFAIALMNESASRQSLKSISQAAPGFYGGLEADVRSASTARALGAIDALVSRRKTERVHLLKAQMQAAFTSANYTAITKFTRLLLQSAALGLGALLAVQEQITPGAIIAVTILTARAFAPVEQVVSGWRQLSQAWESYLDIKLLLSRTRAHEERVRLPNPKGNLSVSGLAAAPVGVERPAIQNVSFQVPSGTVVGVVGPSGSGKSTLVSVLANALDPLAGEVRLDGASLSDWNPRDLAKHIGYLPQSVDLLTGTIAENISRFQGTDGLSADEVSEMVVEAAKAAGAHDMILRLPLAYDTPVGAGVGLSVGQSQRVGLARALFGAPVLLVLDEPNASLDGEGEAALIEAIRGARARGATVVMVAHRASVMSVVDSIAVVQDGRLIEFGPRDKVVARLAAASGAQPMHVAAKAEGAA